LWGEKSKVMQSQRKIQDKLKTFKSQSVDRTASNPVQLHGKIQTKFWKNTSSRAGRLSHACVTENHENSSKKMGKGRPARLRSSSAKRGLRLYERSRIRTRWKRGNVKSGESF